MADFDGVTQIMTLDAPTGGVLNQTAEQVYDDAKQWFLAAGPNRRGDFPFLTSGGEPITVTTIAGQYYFFRNDLGWRIETTDESQDVFWEGNLIPTDLDQRMFNTMPGRTIAHIGLQPLVTGLSGLELRTVEELMSYIVEAGFSYLQVYRILAAHAAGRVNEPVDGTYSILGLDGATTRIAGTEQVNGGRIITTVDGT